MISLCHSCHTNYWRYRRDHPPRGYCSYPCFVAGLGTAGDVGWIGTTSTSEGNALTVGNHNEDGGRERSPQKTEKGAHGLKRLPLFQVFIS